MKAGPTSPTLRPFRPAVCVLLRQDEQALVTRLQLAFWVFRL